MEAQHRASMILELRNVAAQLARSDIDCANSSTATASVSASASASATGIVQNFECSGPSITSLQSERNRFLQGVFRPSHCQPTMTVEEFGRLELKEALRREKVIEHCDSVT